MSDILIIDDSVHYCNMLAEHIQHAGHGVSVSHNIADGLKKAQRNIYDVVFLDIQLPDGSGLEILPWLQQLEQAAEIIIISGYGDAKSAEIAITSGAWDFIHKQSSTQSILLSLTRALQYRESKQKSERKIAYHAPDIVGTSSRMKACLDTAAQAASSDVSTLISGETGTGKELFARSIHENSSRHNEPFVVVDCASLPENLVGSILFGYEKGSFTGADNRKDGLIKHADGGTLFLDEIGEMPLDLQKSFLRVIQERCFRPVGARNEVRSDFRLISATNKNLDELVEKNRFRSDLLFRIRALTVAIPPLRERMEDLATLASHFVVKECRLRGREIKGISENFHEAIESYDWPGNVRELENAIYGSVSKAGAEPVLFAKHLPINIRVPVAQASIPNHSQEGYNANSDIDVSLSELKPIKEMRMNFEKAYLRELINQSEGNIEKACSISQLSRPQVYSTLKKHGLRLK